LVHISEMSDRFVKNPLETVKAGDVLEFRIISLDTDRRRIGLSRKTEKTGNQGNSPKPVEIRKSGGKKGKPEYKDRGKPQETKVTAKPERKPAPDSPGPTTRSTPPGPRKDDDGTMYNPFAEAFKKMGKKS